MVCICASTGDQVLMALSNNKGSGEPEQMRRYARALAAHIHKVWMWMKTQTIFRPQAQLDS